MYLRHRGRQILILHSYRDGRGNVVQRSLGHFQDTAGLERQLAIIPDELAHDCEKLRNQAQTLLLALPSKAASPERRAERISKAIRSVRTALANENDPEVHQLLTDELQQLRSSLPPEPIAPAESAEEALRAQVQTARSALSPRRHRFDPSDPSAQPYLNTLDRLAEVLASQGRLAEEAQILAQRVDCCATPQSRLAYGAALHRLGEFENAILQYARLPEGEVAKHYNSAAACCQIKRPKEAMIHLLRAINRDPQVVKALASEKKGLPVRGGRDYWEKFGDLWNADARQFILTLWAQPVVRLRLSQAAEQRVKFRNLVSPRAHGWLLEKLKFQG